MVSCGKIPERTKLCDFLHPFLAGFMFVIQETRLVNNRAAHAAGIQAIAKKEDSLGSERAIGKSFEHRNIALKFEWEEMRKRFTAMQESYLTEFSHSVATETQLRSVECDLVSKRGSEIVDETEHAHRMLVKALDKDLKKISDHFTTIYEEVRKSCNLMVESDRADVKNRASRQKAKVEKRNACHLESILNLYKKGEMDLQSYFDGIIDENNCSIHELETRLDALKQEIKGQEESIAILTEDNAVVSQPLSDLQSRRAKLREKLDIADAGTIAHANFSRSVYTLEKKLKSIELQIEETKHAVDLLSNHDCS